MQISALGVDVTDGDLGANGNVREGIGHTSAAESMLELGAHETVALAGIAEDEEVNAKHGHVEDHGDKDETERAGSEVPNEQSRRNTEVTEQRPELFEGTETDGGDSEQTDPFAANHRAEGKTGHGEPDPPGFGERLVMVFIAECGPCESGERGEEDERRVEENVAGLGDHAVFECDEKGSEEGSGDTTIEGTESEICERNGRNAHESRDHSHGDIRYMFVDSV